MKIKLQTLLLLLATLCMAQKTHAQQSNDTSVIAGHFEMDTTIGSKTHHINVNYALSPAPFSTTMNVQLNTADNVLFNVDVVDASNAVVLTWTPSAVSNNYNHDLDISSLASGTYAVKIRKYGGSTVLNSISITKP